MNTLLMRHASFALQMLAWRVDAAPMLRDKIKINLLDE
jgi:hypothetical protein